MSALPLGYRTIEAGVVYNAHGMPPRTCDRASRIEFNADGSIALRVTDCLPSDWWWFAECIATQKTLGKQNAQGKGKTLGKLDCFLSILFFALGK